MAEKKQFKLKRQAAPGKPAPKAADEKPPKKAAPAEGKAGAKRALQLPAKGQKKLNALRVTKGQRGGINAPAAVKQKAGTEALSGARKMRGKQKADWVNVVMFFLLAFGCVGFSIVMITRKSPMMSALSLLVVFLCLAGVYVQLKAPFMAAIQLIVYAGAVVVLFLFVIMSMGLKDAYEDGGWMPRGEIRTTVVGFVLSGVAGIGFFIALGMEGQGQLVGMGLAGLLWAATLAYFISSGVSSPFTRFAGLAGASFAVGQIVRLATLTKTFFAVPEASTDGKLAPLAVASPLGKTYGSAKDVGTSVFTENVFAFEALSLLLLAAIVAAVVIVRSRKEAAK